MVLGILVFLANAFVFLVLVRKQKKRATEVIVLFNLFVDTLYGLDLISKGIGTKNQQMAKFISASLLLVMKIADIGRERREALDEGWEEGWCWVGGGGAWMVGLCFLSF